jgi:HAE1 family hydrophobic/amphiphilic exporter-1
MQKQVPIMFLSDVSIRRPVFATMMSLGLMILGAVGYGYLGVDLFPDVNFPVVVISTPYPGASPKEVETQVSRPIEDTVASINGVDKLRSYSREGFSTVVIEFKLETNIQEAAQDVRDRMGGVRSILPRDILDPIINRLDPTAAPIMIYTFSGPQPPDELRHFADKTLKARLEQITGVAGVIIGGGLEREVQLNFDPEKLESYGLSLQQVSQILNAENINVPAGRLEAGANDVSLRTLGEFQSIDQIGQVAVSSVNGTQVLVRDLLAKDPKFPDHEPKVTDGFKEPTSFIRVNGESAISIQIQKQAGTNTVDIAKAVQKRITKDINALLPPGTKLSPIIDQSTFIVENTDQVTDAIVFGGAMAILIVFIFMLDWRSTLISALALPTSVIATFFVMYLLNFTLNMMSLMALSLAIGLLIDDAVVVRENIFRHMEMGEDPATAASRGTSEIGLAVTATTLAVVAVFVPVAFMSGMVGQFFKQFGLTVAAAVLVSLFVAFTLDPMLSAHFVKQFDKDRHQKLKKGWISGPILWVLDGFDSIYRFFLGWALRLRFVVILLAFGALIFSGSLAGKLGGEFVPISDRGQFIMNVDFPPGTSLDETSRRMAMVEERIMKNKNFVTLYTTIGTSNEANRASIQFVAVPKTERKESLQELKEFARSQTIDIPDAKADLADVGMVGGGGRGDAPIAIYIKGDDMNELSALADKVQADLKANPNLGDIVNTYAGGRPERRLVFDRAKLSDLGLSTGQVALEVRAAADGLLSGKYRDGEDEFDIRVRLDPLLREGTVLLDSLAFRTRAGKTVKLGEIASNDLGEGPNTIERLNRQRQITVTAYPKGTSLGTVLPEVKEKLGKYELPPGYSFYFSGQAERMEDSKNSMLVALGLAVLFIYIVLASQFESFIHPFTIMMSLPMAFIGAIVALYLGGKSLSMPAMIGIVFLMGLVTKNGILLVDYINQMRDQGMNRTEAILKAGPTRLRPILMTSMAMIVGMVPSAFSTGSGSEFRSPMSLAVIGGVISSTFLTLLVVPVVYSLIDWFTPRGFNEWRVARRAKRTAKLAKKAAKLGGVTTHTDDTSSPASTPAE